MGLFQSSLKRSWLKAFSFTGRFKLLDRSVTLAGRCGGHYLNACRTSFARIEVFVCGTEKVLHIHAGGVCGYATCRTDLVRPLLLDVPFTNPPGKPFNRYSRLGSICIGHDDHKLIASIASYHVFGAKVLLEQGSNIPQHAIPDDVTELSVKVLKVVYVDEHHGKRRLISIRTCNLSCHRFSHEA